MQLLHPHPPPPAPSHRSAASVADKRPGPRRESGCCNKATDSCIALLDIFALRLAVPDGGGSSSGECAGQQAWEIADALQVAC